MFVTTTSEKSQRFVLQKETRDLGDHDDGDKVQPNLIRPTDETKKLVFLLLLTV